MYRKADPDKECVQVNFPECNWQECRYYIDDLKNRRKTFTKVAVTWLLILGVINGTIPYVLSFFGKEPVDVIGAAWITEIVAVILGYLCKAYFETKQEKKQALEDWQAGKDGDNSE